MSKKTKEKSNIKIPGLLEVVSMDRVTEVIADAYANYPLLMESFPEKNTRKNALEATIRFYGQYDMYFGKIYTLDEDVFELALLLEAKDVQPKKSKCLSAGCYSFEYQDVKERMEVEDRKKRLNLYKELKKLEKTVPVPKDYLYLDYFAVTKDKQGEGRGTKFMKKICEYADSKNQPIVLYTTSNKAARFFEWYDFQEIATVTSDKFGFTNTYLKREPKPTPE